MIPPIFAVMSNRHIDAKTVSNVTPKGCNIPILLAIRLNPCTSELTLLYFVAAVEATQNEMIYTTYFRNEILVINIMAKR